MNTVERTRNHEKESSSNYKVHPSQAVISSSNTHSYSNLNILINEAENYHNSKEDRNLSVFTPESKSYRNKGSRSSRCDQKQNDSEPHSNNKVENDSSSSPDPLSSRLEGEKMMIYHTENMQELYLDKMNHAQTEFLHDFQTFSRPSHMAQVSGDKETPSERQTMVEDPDTP